MNDHLNSYLRRRAQTLGMTMSDVGRKAGLSRQTLYGLAQVPHKLPSLQTIVSLAQVLEVHPLKLLQALFEDVPASKPAPNAHPHNDQSAFIPDVTFPDGTLVLPGQRFTKTWELQNVGRVAWADRYLQCVDDELVVYNRYGEDMHLACALQPVMSRIPVPLTLPGGKVLLSVEFVAPMIQGTVISYWKSFFADGTPCFPQARGLSVTVRVCALASAAQEMR